MRSAFVVFALCGASPAWAVQRPTTLGELCARSALVVVGEVTGQESIFAADGSGRIETWVDVAVLRTLRGDPGPAPLRLSLPGGTVGDLRLTVEDTPVLATDARYLLLLAPRADGAGWRVYGGEAGARPVQQADAVTLADLGGCHAP